MKIAHIGLKGLPAKFGGIEAFVEGISKELVNRRHRVVVYSRKWYTQYDSNKYHGIINGIIIRHTPTVKIRLLNSLVHGLTSTIDILRRDYDIVHFHGNISYVFIPLLKIFKKKTKTVITFHGQLWLPAKYNWFEKKIIKLFTDIGIWFCDKATSVSPDIVKIYSNKRIYLTPIGIKVGGNPMAELIKKINLQPQGYVLFLGVLEKNKRVDWIIKAFNKINTPLKLVIAGDTPDKKYKSLLFELARGNDKIIFTGFVTGQFKEELISNCLLFVLPSDTEGMPVAIVEAIGYGKPCLVRNIISFKCLFREGETGFLIENENDLCVKLEELLKRSPEYLANVGLSAKKELSEKYSYRKTVDTLEELYNEIKTG